MSVSPDEPVSQLLAAPCSFQVSSGHGGDDAAWVRVVGELDIATAPQLERSLRSAQLRARRVALDLRELTFVDCRGVRVIVDACVRVREAGGRLVVIRGPSHVNRVFGLTGTVGAVEFVDLDAGEPPAEALDQARRELAV